MRKSNYLLLFAILALATGCKFFSHSPAGGVCKSNFKCLIYPTTSAASWSSGNSDSNFVFSLYYTGSQNALQLKCYGQQAPVGDSIGFIPLSDSFPLYKDSCIDILNAKVKQLEFTGVGVPAAYINAMVAAKTGDNLLFVPYSYSGSSNSNHLSFHIYLITYTVGTTISFKNLSSIIPESGIVQTDFNGNQYINMNPCPPAHINIQ